jgi:hypothetical protein
MSIDPQAKKILDLRLAKGEITRDDYLAACHAMAQTSETPASPSMLKGALASIAAAKDRIHESRKTICPTRAEPYHVDADLQLFPTHLRYAGQDHPYTQIEAVSYSARSDSLNLVPISHDARLWIQLKGGKSIFATSSTVLFRTKTFNRILNAHDFLSKVTFNQRLQPYLSEIEAKGFCSAGGARICRNGDVEQDGLRANLKVAHKNDGISFSRFGNNPLGNYHVITITTEERNLLSRKKIRLKLLHDFDVVRALILWLCEHP